MSAGALLLELTNVPALPGAACRGRTELFDATVGKTEAGNPPRVVVRARAKAREVCAACPCLEPCSAWIEALPLSRRPRGIVGGKLIDLSGRCPADEGRKRRHAG